MCIFIRWSVKNTYGYYMLRGVFLRQNIGHKPNSYAKLNATKSFYFIFIIRLYYRKPQSTNQCKITQNEYVLNTKMSSSK